MEPRVLYIIFLLMVALASPTVCQQGATYGSICFSGRAQDNCTIGLSCDYKQPGFAKYCVCPSGQFYQNHTGTCQNVTMLRADNLHLNGSPNETELSLAWDRPLDVTENLTYRMVINGTENITSISTNMYTLTNRQPGTPYQIQIYTSTLKDPDYYDVKVENNNPLQGTFCTKPAVPGSLETNIDSNSSVTLQFFKSEGRVESYSVTLTSSVSQNQSITSDEVVGDWINVTFYNIEPGELYDITIKANSCGLESEGKMGYFIISLTVGATCKPTNKDPRQCEAYTACEDVGDHYECVLYHPSVCTPCNAAGDSGVVVALGVLSAVLFIACAVLAFCVYTMNKKLRTIQPAARSESVRTMSTDSLPVSRPPTSTHTTQSSVTLNEGHSSPELQKNVTGPVVKEVVWT